MNKCLFFLVLFFSIHIVGKKIGRSLTVTTRKLDTEEHLHPKGTTQTYVQKLDSGVVGRLLAGTRRVLKHVFQEIIA